MFRIPLCATLFVCFWSSVAGADNERHVYAPDGQLLSNLLRVYTTVPLSTSDKPALQLLERDALISRSNNLQPVSDKTGWEPMLVVPDVRWEETVRGQPVYYNGTLLLFNLGERFRLPWWVPGKTVSPVLEWGSGGDERVTAIGERAYVANNTGAVFWSFAAVVFTLIVLWILVALRERDWNPGHALSRYIENADGRMSLALMQMALWTLAVGGLVLGFALVRVRVPDIPATLVVLMGLSAGTGLVGHWQVKREQIIQDSGQPGQNASRHGRLVDLINIQSVDGVDRASLAKAQLLFWTILAIGLFVFKSMQDGELWEVNDQLLVLMGISQASFLGRTEVEIGRKKTEEEKTKTQQTS